MMMMLLLIEEDREKEEARHSKKIHFPGIILYYLRLQVIPPGTVTGTVYIVHCNHPPNPPPGRRVVTGLSNTRNCSSIKNNYKTRKLAVF